MINKKEFIKIAKKILHPQHVLREKRYTYPMREWFLGLISTIAIITASTVWSTQMYFKYQKDLVNDGSASSQPVAVYRESLVKAALEKFSQNKTSLDFLLTDKVKEISEDTPIEIDYSGINEIDSVTTGQESATSSKSDNVIETSSSTSSEVNISPKDRAIQEDVLIEFRPTALN
jgi:hypothetical protein